MHLHFSVTSDICIKMDVFPPSFAEAWGQESPSVQVILMGPHAPNARGQHHPAGTPDIRHRLTDIDPLKGFCHRIPLALRATSGK